MKYAWIAEQGNVFALTEMCDVLDVSISGYRAWKRGGQPDRKRLTDSQMLALIQAIHAELKGAYGSPRMMRELRTRGFSASKERVERLMRDNGIYARHKRRYKVTTDSKHGLPVAENLLARNFTPTAPNQVWTSDIVTDTLTMAWFRKRPAVGLVHHSDRGSQYASHAFQDKLTEYGMTCSMSRKGNCWDNAPTESWFNSFKNERVHGIRYATHADMKAASFEYIEVFYNRKRQHSTLGYKSPVQFLKDWNSEQHQEKQVA